MNYDTYDKLATFKQKPIEIQPRSYWGYVTPKLEEVTKDGEILVNIGLFWTEQKLNHLLHYLWLSERDIRHVIKKNGMVTYYKNMAKRTSDKKRWSEDEAARLQIQADEFKDSIGLKEEPLDTTCKKLLSFGSSWCILDLIMRGLIAAPSDYIIPQAVRMVLDGSAEWAKP